MCWEVQGEVGGGGFMQELVWAMSIHLSMCGPARTLKALNATLTMLEEEMHTCVTIRYLLSG